MSAVVVKDAFGNFPRNSSIRRIHGNECATVIDAAFVIDGVVVAHAMILEETREATRRCADRRTGKGRSRNG